MESVKFSDKYSKSSDIEARYRMMKTMSEPRGREAMSTDLPQPATVGVPYQYRSSQSENKGMEGQTE